MEEPESKQSIVETLSRDWKRHPVLRVGSAYCVTAWLILQVAETVLPNYDVPDWVMPSLINVLLALFPVVLIAARFTRVSSLIPAESDVICEQETEREPDPLEQAGEILRLESPELDIPISISERMRVTTAACSLTGIRAGRDDRELLLGIIPAIDEQVKAIVERYEGIRLPSGRNAIVIAFGYPNLHEDDVRRAAKACQEILALLSNQHSDDPDASILARAGLYTGTIIVNDDDSQEDELALLGDNTTVAEWLQAFAPEGGIALSAGSANMLSAYFMLEEIGRHSHPRLGQDVPVCSLGPELSRQWQQVMVEQADLFGRQNEYRLLLDHWQTVLDGESQFLLLVGEAGIGKSSLIYRVVRELLSGEPLRLIILNCESYNANSPFRPVISYLEQQVYDGDLGLPHETRLEKLRNYLDELGADAAMAVPLLASLLSIETMEPDLQIDESSKMIREKTLNLIVDLLQAQAKIQPLLLVVEDLHWADPSTTDLIERLLSDTPEHRIYGMFSARPDFQSPWSNLSHVFAIHLNKLPDRVAEELVREKFGDHAVPEWLIRHIVVECGGIPLFLEELVRALQGSTESLVDADPETLKIPPNLQASMDARVAKLGRGKPLLQLCSVIGQQFSYELLRKVVRGSDDQTLSNVLANLVREGLLYQKGIIPDADFKFKHRLLMEAVYQSLLVKTRAELHGTIAETIEVFFPDLCVTAPVRMAQHFSLSGDPEKAIDYRIMQPIGRKGALQTMSHSSRSNAGWIC